MSGHGAGLIACIVLTAAGAGGTAAAFAMEFSRRNYGSLPVLAAGFGGTFALWAVTGWLIWLGVQP